MRKIINSFLTEKPADIIFPAFCYGCKKENDWLCEACFSDYYNPHSNCPHCDIRLPFGRMHADCRRHITLNRLFTAANYKNETVKKLIGDFKYKNAYSLARPLANLTAAWIKEQKYTHLFEKDITAVAVPAHTKKLKRRGFNPAREIAAHFCAGAAGLKFEEGVLTKIKNTDAQVEAKTKNARVDNIKNAFAVEDKNKINKKIVLLVDDVITTGSTMSECAKILRRAGAKEVWGLTVARD